VEHDSTSTATRASREERRSLRDRIDHLLATHGERSSRRIHPALPFSIRLDHPPSVDPRPRYGHGRPPHPRLETLLMAGSDRYRAALEEFAPYFDDLERIPLRGTASSEPCWINEWLIGLDTVSLYAFARSRKPARYVEVGSGQSTKVLDRARRDGDFPMEITSIDPSPRAEVDALCDAVARSPLEVVDLAEAFGSLQAGDMVFFDSSHRVFPNSDCVAFFLDVLPSLPVGVLVGIHDVYLPDDYPDGFIEWWWSEQYLLAALLLGEPAWLEVVLPAFYATGRPELAAKVDDLFDRPGLREVNRRGSVFWLEIVTR